MIAVQKEKRSSKRIQDYLSKNDNVFIPHMSLRLDIAKFASKLYTLSEQWWVIDRDRTIGFMACYFNDPNRALGYISTISIVKDKQGMGLGEALLKQAINFASQNKFDKLRLEVHRDNEKAIRFYMKNGFHNMLNEESDRMYMEMLFHK